MALIVETGEVVANANSYASIAEVDAYHLARGNTAWTGDDAAKEAAILRAMGFLEALPWKGRKTAYSNPLKWPRADVVDVEGFAVPRDEVPAGVINALCEAALVELQEAGALSPALERGGMVTRQTVDVITTEYAPGAPASTTYTAITAPLRGLLRSMNVVDLVRA